MKIHQVLLAAAASAAAAVPAWAQNPTATATYTDTLLGSGVYQYNITLTNTSTAPTNTIGIYWFSWIPGAGFLSAAPTNVMSPSGWTDQLTNSGAAILWMASMTSLAPGATLTGFSFDSTETPAQLAGKVTGTGLGVGDPVTTSYVYKALPTPISLAALNATGTKFVTTASAPRTSVAEPATLGLLGLGLAGALVTSRKRKTGKTPTPT